MEWAGVLGSKVGTLPMRYLGAWLGLSPKKCIFWRPLIEKIKSKLTDWKCKSTNNAGRILLKAAIDSTPIYWFNLFSMPKTVSKEIDTIIRDFLWGWNYDKDPPTRKIHLLKWEKICKRKELGGLDIPIIQMRNKALLGKWWWR